MLNKTKERFEIDLNSEVVDILDRIMERFPRTRKTRKEALDLLIYYGAEFLNRMDREQHD